MEIVPLTMGASASARGALLAAELAAETATQDARGALLAAELAAETATQDDESTPPPNPSGARSKRLTAKLGKPTTYQCSRWNFAGGQRFEDVLKGTGEDAPVRLVDAHWLVSTATGSGAGKIRLRQQFPDEAFVSLDALKMYGCPEAMLLPVVCVSYPWLTPTHPDPHGAHLATLAVALQALISEPADVAATLTGPSSTQRYGVFIDYCSLFQHPNPGQNEFRTPHQDAKFKQGLSMLGTLYAAIGTTVLRLTAAPDGYPVGYELPDGCNVAAYADRG